MTLLNKKHIGILIILFVTINTICVRNPKKKKITSKKTKRVQIKKSRPVKKISLKRTMKKKSVGYGLSSCSSNRSRNNNLPNPSGLSSYSKDRSLPRNSSHSNSYNLPNFGNSSGNSHASVNGYM